MIDVFNHTEHTRHTAVSQHTGHSTHTAVAQGKGARGASRPSAHIVCFTMSSHPSVANALYFYRRPYNTTRSVVGLWQQIHVTTMTRRDSPHCPTTPTDISVETHVQQNGADVRGRSQQSARRTPRVHRAAPDGCCEIRCVRGALRSRDPSVTRTCSLSRPPVPRRS
jgi:hypothetical protein